MAMSNSPISASLRLGRHSVNQPKLHAGIPVETLCSAIPLLLHGATEPTLG